MWYLAETKLQQNRNNADCDKHSLEENYCLLTTLVEWLCQGTNLMSHNGSDEV